MLGLNPTEDDIKDMIDEVDYDGMRKYLKLARTVAVTRKSKIHANFLRYRK